MMKKYESRKRINIVSVGVCICVALVLSVIFIALESWLVLNGYVAYEVSSYLCVLIYFISMFGAGVLVRLIYKDVNMLHMLFSCAGCLFFIIAVNVLVYSEGIHNIVYNILGAGGGAVISLLHIRQLRSSKSRRKKLRFR